MANEIQVNLYGRVLNGTFEDIWPAESKQITQSAAGGAGGVQVIGTSEEAITTVDVSTLGLFWFKNLDGTNYVDIGPDSGGSMVALIRLMPGESCFGRFKPGVTIKAQANTSSIKLKKLVLEN